MWLHISALKECELGLHIPCQFRVYIVATYPLPRQQPKKERSLWLHITTPQPHQKTVDCGFTYPI